MIAQVREKPEAKPARLDWEFVQAGFAVSSYASIAPRFLIMDRAERRLFSCEVAMRRPGITWAFVIFFCASPCIYFMLSFIGIVALQLLYALIAASMAGAGYYAIHLGRSRETILLTSAESSIPLLSLSRMGRFFSAYEVRLGDGRPLGRVERRSGLCTAFDADGRALIEMGPVGSRLFYWSTDSELVRVNK